MLPEVESLSEPIAGQARDDSLLAAAQRRAVPVLAGMQVLGGVGVAAGIAVNGLLAKEISGSTALSGLAQTMGVLGAAALAVPMARVAVARGRRPALSIGYLIAAVGALTSLGAAVTSQFWLLLIGAGLFGGGSASGLQSRYAAIDAADPAHRGRSLSLVVWAGTVGSVLGPNLSDAGARVASSLHLPSLAGPYVFSVVGFVAAAGVCLALLRPDPLLTARTAAQAPPGQDEHPRERDDALPRAGLGEALRCVRARPRAVLGLTAVGSAHAVMVSVMVMTPVHLHDGGATLRIVGLVISVHIAGMYAASPLMGWIADRFGRVTGILVGLVILAAALVLAALSGPMDHLRLGVALTLLGLGWSACIVAGSTLVSESVPLRVRTAVQGVSDLVMGAVAAAAGALAGPILAEWGYSALAGCAAVLLVPVLVLARSATRRSDALPPARA